LLFGKVKVIIFHKKKLPTVQFYFLFALTLYENNSLK